MSDAPFEPDVIPFSGVHREDDLALHGPRPRERDESFTPQGPEIPEDHAVLRALPDLELEEGVVRLPWKRYCWNDTVDCCTLRDREGPGAEVQTGRVCVVAVRPGMEIVDLPPGGCTCERRP